MKALKILGVVFGVLLLLAGAGFLAGSALIDQGRGAFDEQLAKDGLAGPGRVRSPRSTRARSIP